MSRLSTDLVLRLRPKRLIRALPIPARDVLLRALPAGAMERDFLVGHFGEGTAGAEIGVHEGDFSRRLLHLGKPARLHLIDPWIYESSAAYAQSLYGGRRGGDQARMDGRHAAVQRRFRREIETGQVAIHRRRSAEASAAFADETLDWVYVDGDHRHEAVLRDLELYLPKVKSGGLLAGDDYGEGGWWGDGVRTAVDAFLGRAPCALVGIRHRQFILRKL
jgi:hypothetical protein